VQLARGKGEKGRREREKEGECEGRQLSQQIMHVRRLLADPVNGQLMVMRSRRAGREEGREKRNSRAFARRNAFICKCGRAIARGVAMRGRDRERESE
jgi:hypothetical protein